MYFEINFVGFEHVFFDAGSHACSIFVDCDNHFLFDIWLKYY